MCGNSVWIRYQNKGVLFECCSFVNHIISNGYSYSYKASVCQVKKYDEFDVWAMIATAMPSCIHVQITLY